MNEMRENLNHSRNEFQTNQKFLQVKMYFNNAIYHFL